MVMTNTVASHLSVPEEFPTQMTFGFVWGIDIMLEIGVSSEFSQDSRIKQVYKPQVVPVDASEVGILDIIKPVNNGINSIPKLVFMFFCALNFSSPFNSASVHQLRILNKTWQASQVTIAIYFYRKCTPLGWSLHRVFCEKNSQLRW